MTLFLKKILSTTAKPSRIVFVLVAAAAVLSVGYILALAVLAPQQLAEATAAATDLICDKCVGTSDIGDNAVTSAKIGGSQVKNSDIAGDAVTSGKIADGQVFGSDIAAVTIGSSDLADSAVTSSKLAGGAVKPNLYRVVGPAKTIDPGSSGNAFVDCPAGTILTGGGFVPLSSVELPRITSSHHQDENTWVVSAFNEQRSVIRLQAVVICIGPSP
jgi:hypothetical protein